MRQLTVLENLSLDLVMQAPGSPTEDPSGGFTAGGWAAPYGDHVLAEQMGAGFGRVELLFGRRTFDAFAAYWPQQTDGNPFTEVLDATRKFVVGRGGSPEPRWANSTALTGEAAVTVADLKASEGQDLLVMGSGELVQTLLQHGLVDQLVLCVHPLVLGHGKQLQLAALAREDRPATLRLVSSVTTTTGVVVTTYRVERVSPA